MPEARLEDAGAGLVPVDDGWFVVNARDAAWLTSEHGGRSPGSLCCFESPELAFPQLGVWTPRPGAGSAERPLPRRDAAGGVPRARRGVQAARGGQGAAPAGVGLLPQPSGTEHIFVGAGDGPCMILMTGARSEEEVHYPVSELAARYGASVEEETTDSRRCTPRFEPSRRERPSYWETASLGLAERGTLLHGDWGVRSARDGASADLRPRRDARRHGLRARLRLAARARGGGDADRRVADPSSDRDERRPVRARRRARGRARRSPTRRSRPSRRATGELFRELLARSGGRCRARSSCSRELRERGVVHGIATSGRRPRSTVARRARRRRRRRWCRPRRRRAREARARPLPRVPGGARRRGRGLLRGRRRGVGSARRPPRGHARVGLLSGGYGATSSSLRARSASTRCRRAARSRSTSSASTPDPERGCRRRLLGRRRAWNGSMDTPAPSSATTPDHPDPRATRSEASLIWGINTIFLLDAGLSNLEAFAATRSSPPG